MGLLDDLIGSASNKRKAALRVLILGPYEKRFRELKEIRCSLVNHGYIQASLVADFKDSPDLPTFRKQNKDRIYFREKSLAMIKDSQARIYIFYNKYPSHFESIEYDHGIEEGLGKDSMVLSDNWNKISKLIKQQAAASNTSIEDFSSPEDVIIKSSSFLDNLVDDLTIILDDESEMRWLTNLKENLCKNCERACKRKDLHLD